MKTMAGGLLGVDRHQALEFGLGLFMVEMGLAGLRIDAGELRPSIGAAHIDDADRLDPGLWRLDAEQLWLLTILDAAPELALRGDDQVLIERVGMGQDLDSFAASGND